MERIVIFGASVGGERALQSLTRRQNAVLICDNNPSKHGTLFHGIPVVPPTQLGDVGYDRVLIASSAFAEIFDQLLKLGIPPQRIDVLDIDVLRGFAMGRSRGRWLAVGAVVVLLLAAYGLIRLVIDWL